MSTVLLSTAAHGLGGGGAAPGVRTMLLLFVAVDVAFRVFARRELSLGRVATGVALVQVGLHLLMAMGQASMAGPADHAGGHAPAGHPHGVLMLVAHAAAGAVLAWWLRRGEAAAWSAARRLVRTALCLPAPARIDRPMPARPSHPAERSAHCLVLALVSSPRRGPPQAA